MSLFNVFKRGVLYYPGCLTRFFLKDVLENYNKILSDLEVEHVSIEGDILCCGTPTINAGFATDFEDLKIKNTKFFNDNKVGKIITSCSNCTNAFKEYNIETEHITQTICKNLEKLPTIYDNEEVTYYGKEGHDTKQILRKLGLKVVEIKDAACGAEGGLQAVNKIVADKIAQNILKQVKTKKLVVTSPYVYFHLKENAPSTLKIYELSQLMVEEAKPKKPELTEEEKEEILHEQLD